MTSIYILVDPRNGRVRYVGATENPKEREKAHGGLRDGARRRWKWIEELRRYDMRPSMRIIGEVETAKSASMERMAIRFYLSVGSDLLNACHNDSARGATSRHMTDEEIGAAFDESNGHMGRAAIALGCCWITVRNRLRVMGRRPEFDARINRFSSAEQRARVVSLSSGGMKKADVARAVGMTRTGVAHVLKTSVTDGKQK